MHLESPTESGAGIPNICDMFYRRPPPPEPVDLGLMCRKIQSTALALREPGGAPSGSSVVLNQSIFTGPVTVHTGIGAGGNKSISLQSEAEKQQEVSETTVAQIQHKRQHSKDPLTPTGVSTYASILLYLLGLRN